MTKVKQCTMIEAIICNENENIVEVAKKLRLTLLRHLFVVDANSKPVGIISMTDINNRVVAESRDLESTLAKDIMTAPIDLVELEDDAKETANKMLEKGRTINVVVDNKKIVGVISIDQLIKQIN